MGTRAIGASSVRPTGALRRCVLQESLVPAPWLNSRSPVAKAQTARFRARCRRHGPTWRTLIPVRKSASALQCHPIGLDKAQPPSRDRTGPVEGSIGHAADAISRQLATLKDIKAKKRNLKSKLNF